MIYPPILSYVRDYQSQRLEEICNYGVCLPIEKKIYIRSLPLLYLVQGLPWLSLLNFPFRRSIFISCSRQNFRQTRKLKTAAILSAIYVISGVLRSLMGICSAWDANRGNLFEFLFILYIRIENLSILRNI